MKNKDVRLPAHVKPERYQLTIKPDLDGFVFEGEETIFIHLEKSSSEITLHAKELDITSAEFLPSPRPSPRGRGGDALMSAKIRYDEKAETATLVFGKSLPKGGGELRLKLRGF